MAQHNSQLRGSITVLFLVVALLPWPGRAQTPKEGLKENEVTENWLIGFLIAPAQGAKTVEACEAELAELKLWLTTLFDEQQYSPTDFPLRPQYPEGIEGLQAATAFGARVQIDARGNLDVALCCGHQDKTQIELLKQTFKKSDELLETLGREPGFKPNRIHIRAHRSAKWSRLVEVIAIAQAMGRDEIDFSFIRKPQVLPPRPAPTLFELWMRALDAQLKLEDERMFVVATFMEHLTPCEGLHTLMLQGYYPPDLKAAWEAGDKEPPTMPEKYICRLRGCQCRVAASVVKSILWQIEVAQQLQVAVKRVRVGTKDQGDCEVVSAGPDELWGDVAAKILAVEDSEKVWSEKVCFEVR